MGSERGNGLNVEDLLDPGNLVRMFRQQQGPARDSVIKLITEGGHDVTKCRADGSSLLHSFALLGCFDIVKLLWDKGAQPSILLLDSSTLLHSAVRSTDTCTDESRARILSLFLSSSDRRHNALPINHKNNKGWTALKLAARKQLDRCVEVLLENGADPDIPDLEQFLPLHNAIGNQAIVKLLVTRTRCINCVTQTGETVLYLAVERGLNDCALLLLEHGADPNIANKEAIAPLFLAARSGNLELVRAIIKKGGKVNERGAPQLLAPLHWAAHKEHTEIALLLIENGADIKLKDKEGRTPVSMASPELTARMLEAARQRNPDMPVHDSTPATVISAEEKAVTACCGGNLMALQAMIQAGVSVNHTSGTSSSTLLHLAAYCGQVQVVSFLLKVGADWKMRDNDGDTVLHFACMKEVPQALHNQTLEYLLTRSPAIGLINAQNSRGDSPLLVASRGRLLGRIKLLLAHKADVSIANSKKELPLHRVCSSDSTIEAVLFLAEMSDNIDTQDADGWTPLMYAAKSKSSAVVKYLLQRNADPNKKQCAGFTALYFAAQVDAAGVCEMLIKYGANPSITGGTQKVTPLHIAAHQGMKNVCRVLVEAGALYTIADNDGDTPMSLAENEEVKQVMLAAHAVYCARQRTESSPPRETKEEPDADPPTTTAPSFDDNATVPSNSPTLDTHRLPRGNSKEQDDEEEEMAQLKLDLDQKKTMMKAILQELGTLRADKELLLSRNRSLEEDLQQRDRYAKMTNNPQDGVPSEQKWFIPREDFTMEEKPINETAQPYERFCSVHRGTFRMSDVIVRRVRKTDKWTSDVYKTFFRDVEKLGQMRSPYLVQFIGAFIDEPSKECMVLMEDMSRGSLNELLHVDKVPLNCSQKRRIARDIASGMVYLHSLPLLHHWLVPSNILIGEHLNAKVSDYAFYETKVQSKYLKTIKEEHRNKEQGTYKNMPIFYTPPEYIERNEYTQASDVYSFGMMIYEICTEKRPFEDVDMGTTMCVAIMKVMMGMRPPLPEKFQKRPCELMEMCWKAEPHLRPTFKEVLTKIRQYIENEHV